MNDNETERLRGLLRESLRLLSDLRVQDRIWRQLNPELQRAITAHGNALEQEFKPIGR
jgi:hypothetical protein